MKSSWAPALSRSKFRSAPIRTKRYMQRACAIHVTITEKFLREGALATPKNRTTLKASARTATLPNTTKRRSWNSKPSKNRSILRLQCIIGVVKIKKKLKRRIIIIKVHYKRQALKENFKKVRTISSKLHSIIQLQNRSRPNKKERKTNDRMLCQASFVSKVQQQ